MAVGGPLLIVTGELIDPAIVEEIQRLEPGTITTIGLEATDLTAISDLTPEQMTNAPEPIDDGTDVVVDSPARVWLVDDSTTLASAVMSAAAATGDTVLVVGGDDLRAMTPEQIDAVRLAGDAPAATVGPITDNADWQLDVIRSGQEVPGGGLLVFPDRRLIALYGHPGVPVLGVLGEQSPQEGIERLRPILEEYSADGIPAVPTFEIIATIADATAGADGDYSAEITVEALIPWIEVARDNGAYVILDLQPGRTDFLTQAKRYEELLREPHVGLALDPEWRLKPDQVHLRQIGSVEAAEINTVVEWLAGIVREEALPQKVLVLHQFRVDMIHDRETITIPPELAIVDHVDGQGALDLKYGTWGVLSTQPGSENLWWGWKNFYDEDPQLATPQQVLDLEPTVFMVSFQ
ncbi:hypothetical protein HQ535_01265 [bacterium]|nr:hypothetical protein [bacterium]